MRVAVAAAFAALALCVAATATAAAAVSPALRADTASGARSMGARLSAALNNVGAGKGIADARARSLKAVGDALASISTDTRLGRQTSAWALDASTLGVSSAASQDSKEALDRARGATRAALGSVGSAIANSASAAAAMSTHKGRAALAAKRSGKDATASAARRASMSQPDAAARTASTPATAQQQAAAAMREGLTSLVNAASASAAAIAGTHSAALGPSAPTSSSARSRRSLSTLSEAEIARAEHSLLGPRRMAAEAHARGLKALSNAVAGVPGKLAAGSAARRARASSVSAAGDEAALRASASAEATQRATQAHAKVTAALNSALDAASLSTLFGTSNKASKPSSASAARRALGATSTGDRPAAVIDQDKMAHLVAEDRIAHTAHKARAAAKAAWRRAASAPAAPLTAARHARALMEDGDEEEGDNPFYSYDCYADSGLPVDDPSTCCQALSSTMQTLMGGGCDDFMGVFDMEGGPSDDDLQAMCASQCMTDLNAALEADLSESSHACQVATGWKDLFRSACAQSATGSYCFSTILSGELDNIFGDDSGDGPSVTDEQLHEVCSGDCQQAVITMMSLGGDDNDNSDGDDEGPPPNPKALVNLVCTRNGEGYCLPEIPTVFEDFFGNDNDGGGDGDSDEDEPTDYENLCTTCGRALFSGMVGMLSSQAKAEDGNGDASPTDRLGMVLAFDMMEAQLRYGCELDAEGNRCGPTIDAFREEVLFASMNDEGDEDEDDGGFGSGMFGSGFAGSNEEALVHFCDEEKHEACTADCAEVSELFASDLGCCYYGGIATTVHQAHVTDAFMAALVGSFQGMDDEELAAILDPETVGEAVNDEVSEVLEYLNGCPGDDDATPLDRCEPLFDDLYPYECLVDDFSVVEGEACCDATTAAIAVRDSASCAEFAHIFRGGDNDVHFTDEMLASLCGSQCLTDITAAYGAVGADAEGAGCAAAHTWNARLSIVCATDAEGKYCLPPLDVWEFSWASGGRGESDEELAAQQQAIKTMCTGGCPAALLTAMAEGDDGGDDVDPEAMLQLVCTTAPGDDDHYCMASHAYVIGDLLDSGFQDVQYEQGLCDPCGRAVFTALTDLFASDFEERQAALSFALFGTLFDYGCGFNRHGERCGLAVHDISDGVERALAGGTDEGAVSAFVHSCGDDFSASFTCSAECGTATNVLVDNYDCCFLGGVAAGYFRVHVTDVLEQWGQHHGRLPTVDEVHEDVLDAVDDAIKGIGSCDAVKYLPTHEQCYDEPQDVFPYECMAPPGTQLPAPTDGCCPAMHELMSAISSPSCAPFADTFENGPPMTDEGIATLCESQCVADITAALDGRPHSGNGCDHANDFAVNVQLVCSQSAGGDYCFPMFAQSDIFDDITAVTDAVLDVLCTGDCPGALKTAAENDDKEDEEEQGGEGGGGREPTASQVLDLMCARNADGFCLPQWPTIAEDIFGLEGEAESNVGNNDNPLHNFPGFPTMPFDQLCTSCGRVLYSEMSRFLRVITRPDDDGDEAEHMKEVSKTLFWLLDQEVEQGCSSNADGDLCGPSNDQMRDDIMDAAVMDGAVDDPSVAADIWIECEKDDDDSEPYTCSAPCEAAMTSYYGDHGCCTRAGIALSIATAESMLFVHGFADADVRGKDDVERAYETGLHDVMQDIGSCADDGEFAPIRDECNGMDSAFHPFECFHDDMQQGPTDEACCGTMSDLTTMIFTEECLAVMTGILQPQSWPPPDAAFTALCASDCYGDMMALLNAADDEGLGCGSAAQWRGSLQAMCMTSATGDFCYPALLNMGIIFGEGGAGAGLDNDYLGTMCTGECPDAAVILEDALRAGGNMDIDDGPGFEFISKLACSVGPNGYCLLELPSFFQTAFPQDGEENGDETLMDYDQICTPCGHILADLALDAFVGGDGNASPQEREERYIAETSLRLSMEWGCLTNAAGDLCGPIIDPMRTQVVDSLWDHDSNNPGLALGQKFYYNCHPLEELSDWASDFENEDWVCPAACGDATVELWDEIGCCMYPAVASITAALALWTETYDGRMQSEDEIHEIVDGTTADLVHRLGTCHAIDSVPHNFCESALDTLYPIECYNVAEEEGACCDSMAGILGVLGSEACEEFMPAFNDEEGDGIFSVLGDFCSSQCFADLAAVIDAAPSADADMPACWALEEWKFNREFICSTSAGGDYCFMALEHIGDVFGSDGEPAGATDAELESVCTGDCPDLVRMFMGQDEHAPDADAMLAFLCTQDSNDNYCVPRNADLLSQVFKDEDEAEEDEGGFADPFDELCTECGRLMTGPMFEIVASTLSDDPEAALFLLVMQRLLVHGCGFNEQGDRCGDVIGAQLDQLGNSDEDGGGVSDALAMAMFCRDPSTQCTESCATPLTAVADEIGCCMYGTTELVLLAEAIFGALGNGQVPDAEALATDIAAAASSLYDDLATCDLLPDLPRSDECLSSLGPFFSRDCVDGGTYVCCAQLGSAQMVLASGSCDEFSDLFEGDASPSPAVLSSLCSSSCYSQMKTVFDPLAPDATGAGCDVATEFARNMNLVCATDGSGNLCYPLLASIGEVFGAADASPISVDTLDVLCSDGCSEVVVSAMAADAEKSEREGAEGGGDGPPPDPEAVMALVCAHDTDNNWCLPPMQDVLSALFADEEDVNEGEKGEQGDSQGFTLPYDDMCTVCGRIVFGAVLDMAGPDMGNIAHIFREQLSSGCDFKEDGERCGPFQGHLADILIQNAFGATFPDPDTTQALVAKCAAHMTGEGSECPADCGPALQDYVDEVGCCFQGNVATMAGTTLALVSGETVVTDADVSDAITHTYAQLGTCSDEDLPQEGACLAQDVQGVVLIQNVLYSYATSTQEIEDAIVAAITRDIAAALGVSPGALEVTLSEDPATGFVVATFTLRVSSAEEASRAEDAINNDLSDSDFAAVDDVVPKTDDARGDGDASIAGQASTDVDEFEEDGAGTVAAAAATIVAVAAATLAASHR